MVRKLKGLKKATLRRKGWIQITDDISFPIHTVGDVTLQKVMTEFEKNLKLPKAKVRPAKPAEIDELKALGYTLNSIPVMVKDFDKTSSEYMDMLVDRNRFESFLLIIVSIDLNYKVTRQKTLWEMLELENEVDYKGLYLYLQELDFTNQQIKSMKEDIIAIRDSNFKTYKEFEDWLDTL